MDGKRGGLLILFSLSVLPKLVSSSVNSEFTHPIVILVAYWDHTPSSKLTTHMGTRALGVPMPVICTVNAVPWVGVLIPAFVCPFESFNGLVNKGELDQPSTHVVEWGCLMERPSRHAACVIGAVWFGANVSDLERQWLARVLFLFVDLFRSGC